MRCSDIYALCEAFPKSYAETLYQETQNLLIQFVTDLLEVSGGCRQLQAEGLHVMDNVTRAAWRVTLSPLYMLEFEGAEVTAATD